MTEEKGLDPVSADKIGEYVKHKGMTRKLFLAPPLLTVHRWSLTTPDVARRCSIDG